MIRLYNTFTRKKEDFIPIEKGKVKMYNCGPTVYNYAHIGNFRAYVCSDILKRWLLYREFQVFQVMNITDVDDKTIRDSQKEKISLTEFTRKYEKAFLEDLNKLRISKPDIFPRATEHIQEMIDLVNTLISKGFAYQADDGIYFKINEFDRYGKLSKTKIDQQKESVRINNDEYDKDNAQDFALWKFYDKKDGDVVWDAPFGKGRPGWHIECSAMSMKHLGTSIDIHTGGIDLVFPHHENEIAQSECCTGNKFVNYWLHNEYILVDGKKMSKSLGNFYTLRDLLDKGYSAKAIRYLLLSSNYRQQLNFTLEGIKAAQNSVDRMQDFVDMLGVVNGKKNPRVKEILEAKKLTFEYAMDDDLNISEALGEVFTLIKDVNKYIMNNEVSKEDAKAIIEFIKEVNSIIDVIDLDKETLPEEIITMMKDRDRARQNKDWSKADSIRDKLVNLGYNVKDTEYGTLVSKR